MLRRYAAGSSAGSGALGKVTSGIDDEVNVELLEPLVPLGDWRGVRPALESRVPAEAVESPPIDALEPLRVKRPIVADNASDS